MKDLRPPSPKRPVADTASPKLHRRNVLDPNLMPWFFRKLQYPKLDLKLILLKTRSPRRRMQDAPGTGL